MKNLPIIAICIFAFCISSGTFGQQNKQKTNKGTSKREIRKRQNEANQRSNTNSFNPVQSMGARENDSRDDLLWHSETANTVYEKAGNLSLTSPSRYGIKKGLELSSILPLNYWMPNIAVKKRWINTNWYFSSRHGLYSVTPGLHWAQNKGYNKIADTSAVIPLVISIRNEFILSRLISSSNTCSREQPFIILTASLGADFGLPFGKSGLTEIEGHLLTNRSPAMIGSGAYGFAKIRADWQINSSMMLGGGLRYYYGNFSGNQAFEQPTEFQIFVAPQLSLSFGYILSLGKYKTPNNLAFLPFFDLTWYFGRKQSRQKGLFQSKMF